MECVLVDWMSGQHLLQDTRIVALEEFMKYFSNEFVCTFPLSFSLTLWIQSTPPFGLVGGFR